MKDFKTVFPTLPGSVTKPVPGYEVKIFDEGNKEVTPGALGKVVIKLPLPPAFMQTLWETTRLSSKNILLRLLGITQQEMLESLMKRVTFR